MKLNKILPDACFSKLSQSIVSKRSNNKLIPNRIIAYSATAILGLSACSNSYKELKDFDVYNQIERTELLNAFSLDYLDCLRKISDMEYKAHIGFNTIKQFGIRGDIQGDVYIKKDKNNSNHISGEINLYKIDSYLEHYEVPNQYGSTTGMAERIYYSSPVNNFKFDAVLDKNENSEDYKIHLSVLDKNNKYKKHTIEKKGDDILLDGELPFEEVHKAERNTNIILLVCGIIMVGGVSALFYQAEKDRQYL